MTIHSPQESYVSSLNRTQKTTLLAFRSVRARDDLQTFANVVTLIELDARPATIVKLTGAPKKLVNALFDREGSRAATGRYKVAIGDYLAKPRPHLEISRFVLEFSHAFEIDGREVLAPGFIRAYRAYLDMCTSPDRMNTETALILANMYAADELYLATCAVDGTVYVRSRSEVRLIHGSGYGDCPYCRSLRVADVNRSALMTIELTEARAAFERVLKGKKPKPDVI